jgi:hypothetical protein
MSDWNGIIGAARRTSTITHGRRRTSITRIPSTTKRQGVIPYQSPKWFHGMTAPM